MEKVIEELTEVNPFELSEKGKKLFYTFMEILDERDEFLERIEDIFTETEEMFAGADENTPYELGYYNGQKEFCKRLLEVKNEEL